MRRARPGALARGGPRRARSRAPAATPSPPSPPAGAALDPRRRRHRAARAQRSARPPRSRSRSSRRRSTASSRPRRPEAVAGLWILAAEQPPPEREPGRWVHRARFRVRARARPGRSCGPRRSPSWTTPNGRARPGRRSPRVRCAWSRCRASSPTGPSPSPFRASAEPRRARAASCSRLRSAPRSALAALALAAFVRRARSARRDAERGCAGGGRAPHARARGARRALDAAGGAHRRRPGRRGGRRLRRAPRATSRAAPAHAADVSTTEELAALPPPFLLARHWPELLRLLRALDAARFRAGRPRERRGPRRAARRAASPRARSSTTGARPGRRRMSALLAELLAPGRFALERPWLGSRRCCVRRCSGSLSRRRAPGAPAYAWPALAEARAAGRAAPRSARRRCCWRSAPARSRSSRSCSPARCARGERPPETRPGLDRRARPRRLGQHARPRRRGRRASGAAASTWRARWSRASPRERASAGDRVGVVVFGDTAFTLCPLTNDGALVAAALERVEAGMAGESTALGDALALAVKRAGGGSARAATRRAPPSAAAAPLEGRLVVLLTDGRSNAGAVPVDVAARPRARHRDARAHRRDRHARRGRDGEPHAARPRAPLRAPRPRHRDAAQASPPTSGGRSFEARSSADSRAVYAEIDALERVTREAPPAATGERAARAASSPAPAPAPARRAAARARSRCGGSRDGLGFARAAAPAAALVALAAVGARRGARGPRRRAASRAPSARRARPCALAARRARRRCSSGALAHVALALLGPPLGRAQRSACPASGVDVVLLFDVSQSMRARDVPPSRLERARALGDAVLAGLACRRPRALAAFAGRGVLLTPLTPDTDALRALLPALDDSLLTRGRLAPRGGRARRARAPSAPRARGRGCSCCSRDGEDPERAGRARRSRSRSRAARASSRWRFGSEAGAPDARCGAASLRDAQGRPVVTPRRPARLRALADADRRRALRRRSLRSRRRGGRARGGAPRRRDASGEGLVERRVPRSAARCARRARARSRSLAEALARRRPRAVARARCWRPRGGARRPLVAAALAAALARWRCSSSAPPTPAERRRCSPRGARAARARGRARARASSASRAPRRATSTRRSARSSPRRCARASPRSPPTPSTISASPLSRAAISRRARDAFFDAIALAPDDRTRAVQPRVDPARPRDTAAPAAERQAPEPPEKRKPGEESARAGARARPEPSRPAGRSPRRTRRPARRAGEPQRPRAEAAPRENPVQLDPEAARRWLEARRRRSRTRAPGGGPGRRARGRAAPRQRRLRSGERRLRRWLAARAGLAARRVAAAAGAAAPPRCEVEAELVPARAFVGQQVHYRLRILRRRDVDTLEWETPLSFPTFRAEWLPGSSGDEPAERERRELARVPRAPRALPGPSGTARDPRGGAALRVPRRRGDRRRPAARSLEVDALPAEGRPPGFAGLLGPVTVERERRAGAGRPRRARCTSRCSCRATPTCGTRPRRARRSTPLADARGLRARRRSSRATPGAGCCLRRYFSLRPRAAARRRHCGSRSSAFPTSIPPTRRYAEATRALAAARVARGRFAPARGAGAAARRRPRRALRAPRATRGSPPSGGALLAGGLAVAAPLALAPPRRAERAARRGRRAGSHEARGARRRGDGDAAARGRRARCAPRPRRGGRRVAAAAGADDAAPTRAPRARRLAAGPLERARFAARGAGAGARGGGAAVARLRSGAPAGANFRAHARLPLPADLRARRRRETPWRKLTGDFVATASFEGQRILTVDAEALTRLAAAAVRDVSHLFRPGHLAQLAQDPRRPRGVGRTTASSRSNMLKNANISAGMVLPSCQDTGTAIVIGKKGQHVWTARRRRGGARARHLRHLHEHQPALLAARAAHDVRGEEHRHEPAGADRALRRRPATSTSFLFVTKGGGSANKTFLFQETQGAPESRVAARRSSTQKIRTLGTAACPPYHLAIVIGGTSAEMTLKTVKLASCRYLDDLPTTGNALGHAIRDLELEERGARS